MHLHFDVGHVPVRVQGSDPSVGPLARRLLAHLGRPGSQEPTPALGEVALTLHPVDALPPVPLEALPLARFDEINASVDRVGTAFHLRAPGVVMDVDPEAGWATALLESNGGSPTLAEDGLAMVLMGLCLLLRPYDLFPLHAAGLVYEDAGVLLSAGSGSGKSTLAASLVCQGWRFLTDDALLLRPTPEAVEALPFRRTFGLLPETLEQFPRIARARPADSPAREKVSVPVASLFPEQAAPACIPRLLVFPEIAGFRRSRLEPLRRSEALLRLASQSGLLSISPLWTREHLDVLRRLTAQTVPYRLLAGRDLLADPRRGAELLLTAMPSAAVT